MYDGKSKLILKHLGFLVHDYKMKFEFQTFDNHDDIVGPIDTYSFFNDDGCFTIRNYVQFNEWDWFYSDRFSSVQSELYSRKIDQYLYLSKNYYLTRSWLKDMSNVIMKQIHDSHSVFGISLR